MRPKITRSNSGMSLLEIVIAVGLMGLVMSYSTGTINSLMAARTKIQDMSSYQKYLDSINDRVTKAFVQMLKNSKTANGHFPVNESEMNSWKNMLNGTSGTYIQDANIGFRITRHTASGNPDRMECSKGYKVIWNSTEQGDNGGCPTDMLGASNIAKGIYEFCVKIDPINVDMFPMTSDLMRQKPVIRYMIQVRSSLDLGTVALNNPANLAKIDGIETLAVQYTMNWHNDEVDWRAKTAAERREQNKCKQTSGLFYVAVQAD